MMRVGAHLPRLSDDRNCPLLRAQMPDLRRHGLRPRTEGPHLAQRRDAALCRLPVARAPPHLPHHVRQARTGELFRLEGDPVQPRPDRRSPWFASHELSVYGQPGGLDIQAIDRPDAAYDIVICSHVLEHVGDDRAALHELLRIPKSDGLLYLAFPDPFREDVTRDWGFPKPEKHGHWRVYGADVAKRFAAYVPDQPVLAYRGQDPVTGEWEGAFLLPRSAERHRWIVEKLGGSVSLFSGPGL